MEFTVKVWNGAGNEIPAMWHANACGLSGEGETLKDALIDLVTKIAEAQKSAR